MNITEDYVSFEIAKLLKEKGFDEKVSTHYLVHPSGFSEFFDKKDEFPELEDVWLKCPTHQMAMKWLREVHKISIDICTVQGKKVSYMFNIWDFSNIYDNKYIGGTFDLREQLYDFKTYEEAAEAACLYVLKNLI